jgi:RNA polymerase sigma-70 factor (ECF subfamily)
VERNHDDVARSDEALLAAWRAGDAKMGELLWQRHSRSVQRFFRNKVPWAVAMDLAQRTIESGLRLQQPVRCFRSYLLGIAKHQLFDYLRSEQRKKRGDADLETLVIDDTVESPEAWVCAKREKRVLLHALRRLPLPIQLVLELRYWERMSDRGIADVLDLPLGTVKSRIAAGRVALREAIARLVSSPEQLQSTLDSLEKWASRTQASATDAVMAELGRGRRQANRSMRARR